MVEFKRKLYRRGSSMETTIPKPLLFAINTDKKHNIVFKFESSSNRWYVEFEKSSAEEKKYAKKKKDKKKK